MIYYFYHEKGGSGEKKHKDGLHNLSVSKKSMSLPNSIPFKGCASLWIYNKNIRWMIHVVTNFTLNRTLEGHAYWSFQKSHEIATSQNTSKKTIWTQLHGVLKKSWSSLAPCFWNSLPRVSWRNHKEGTGGSSHNHMMGGGNKHLCNWCSYLESKLAPHHQITFIFQVPGASTKCQS